MPVLTSSIRAVRAAGPLLSILTALLVFQSAAAASPDLSRRVRVPDFENAVTVVDSGHGWTYSFDYPQVVPGLEFIWYRAYSDMDERRVSFADEAGSVLPEGPLEQWESWIMEGGMSLLSSPDGMATAMCEYWVFTGGAHGMNNSILYRYSLSGGPGSQDWIEIDSRDLLADSAELVRFSAIVCDTLKVRLGPDPDREWILRGAGPYWENYSLLYPVPESSGALAGFTVRFAEYAVGPFCFGQQEVFVPLALLRP